MVGHDEGELSFEPCDGIQIKGNIARVIELLQPSSVISVSLKTAAGVLAGLALPSHVNHDIFQPVTRARAMQLAKLCAVLRGM